MRWYLKRNKLFKLFFSSCYHEFFIPWLQVFNAVTQCGLLWLICLFCVVAVWLFSRTSIDLWYSSIRSQLIRQGTPWTGHQSIAEQAELLHGKIQTYRQVSLKQKRGIFTWDVKVNVALEWPINLWCISVGWNPIMHRGSMQDLHRKSPRPETGHILSMRPDRSTSIFLPRMHIKLRASVRVEVLSLPFTSTCMEHASCFCLLAWLTFQTLRGSSVAWFSESSVFEAH